MRNLLLSNILCLLFISCNYGHYKRLKPYVPAANTKPAELRSVFRDSFNSFLFKTSISLYTKDFSGLLLNRQTAPDDYRIVFTTELGMKLFDLEFKDTAFIVHYCIEQFNKPYILNTLKKDISTLLMNDVQSKTPEFLTDQKNNYTVAHIKKEDGSNYYFMENGSNRLIRIEHAAKRKKKTEFLLDNYTGGFPHHILIKHHDIRLTIDLNLLKR